MNFGSELRRWSGFHQGGANRVAYEVVHHRRLPEADFSF
jgi:hypothetical protein